MIEFEYIPERQLNEEICPLVSIVMPTYNQEVLALKSLETLLNQDYGNLEIIVSDDASTDDTFKRLLERCQIYAKCYGNHKIKLNRNNINIGIIRNYEFGFSISKGKLLVTQGADDFSYPNRVSCIVDNWLKKGGGSMVIFHGLRPMNLDDSPAGYEWWPLTLRNPIGAAMAYTPDVISHFPKISIPSAFEDNVFARRAYLMGGELHVKDILIDYRVGSGMTSSGDARSQRIKIAKSMVDSTIQNLIDLEYVKGRVVESKYNVIKSMVLEIQMTYGLELKMISAESVLDRLIAFWKYKNCKIISYPLDLYGILENYIPMMFPSLGGVSSLLYKLIVKVKKILKYGIFKISIRRD